MRNVNSLYFSQVVVNNPNSQRYGTRRNLIVSAYEKEDARKFVENWKDRYDEITSFAEIPDAIDVNEFKVGETYLKFID